MAFSKGDTIFYPGQGLGKVVDIHIKEVLGKGQSFYEIYLLSAGISILVPLANVHRIKIRRPISKSYAQEIVDMFNQHTIEPSLLTWNARYHKYMEQLQTGIPYEVAGVLKALLSLGITKDLSFGERKMIEAAERMLTGELEYVLGYKPQFKIEKQEQGAAI